MWTDPLPLPHTWAPWPIFAFMPTRRSLSEMSEYFRRIRIANYGPLASFLDEVSASGKCDELVSTGDLGAVCFYRDSNLDPQRGVIWFTWEPAEEKLAFVYFTDGFCKDDLIYCERDDGIWILDGMLQRMSDADG